MIYLLVYLTGHLEWLRSDGKIWVPQWEDDFTRDCLLNLSIRDIAGFFWLESFVELLCGESFDNPFKAAQPIDINDILGFDGDGEHNKTSNNTHSRVSTNHIRTFLRTVRLV